MSPRPHQHPPSADPTAGPLPEPPPEPPPGLRQGPRPLPLHLLAQVSTLLSSRAALPSLRSGSFAWKAHLQPAAEALRQQLDGVDAELFGAAVADETHRRMAGFLDGVEAYRRHPYRRILPPPPVIWQEGGTRLLDYGAAGPAAARRGPPVLVVPSLVNRGYILDLGPERSLMRGLAARGLRPLLVDWGAPGPVERGFGLDDYVAGRLSRALDAVLADAGRPALLGYCMGGLLALGLGLLRQDDVCRLALLATPWDFHAPTPHFGTLLAALRGPLEDAIALSGEAPVDLLQTLFAMIDPGGIERKFRAFARLAPDSAEARAFVAVEDWLNDGVPLTGRVAEEALFGWYVDNQPAGGAWRLAGRAVRPQAFGKPALALVPDRDRIVPPASALALAEALPQGRRGLVAAGHIGMITGTRAESEVYVPLTDWLNRKDEP